VPADGTAEKIVSESGEGGACFVVLAIAALDRTADRLERAQKIDRVLIGGSAPRPAARGVKRRAVETRPQRRVAGDGGFDCLTEPGGPPAGLPEPLREPSIPVPRPLFRLFYLVEIRHHQLLK